MTASTTSRPGKRLRASSHASAPPATSAIIVATLATANESLMGNQSISLPFIMRSHKPSRLFHNGDDAQWASAAALYLHRKSDEKKVLRRELIQIGEVL